jgi:D-3-phosphoglycerate dehydrogenase
MAQPPGQPRPPVVAVVPVRYPQIAEAVTRAGGVLGPPAEADGIVWTDPVAPDELASVLAGSPARWVQLPFAGVEGFAGAGVLEPDRVWTSAKGIYGPAVAEHALALMLAAARGLHRYVKASSWLPSEVVQTRRLKANRVVIVGTGGIGRALARLLEPVEASIVAVNRSGRPMPGASATAPVSDLGDLARGADWVVLAAPLTAETSHLVDAAMLEVMPRQSWLVNVARGELVDTDALVEALAAGAIAGAALDVTDPEPLPDGHPLWGLDNAIITPHVANTWDMALPELAARVERNVLGLAHGQPLEGVVDLSLGY